jgi:hypothetical protein
MAILEAMGLVRKRINRRYRTVRREGNFLPGTLGQGRARGGPGEGQGRARGGRLVPYALWDGETATKAQSLAVARVSDP